MLEIRKLNYVRLKFKTHLYPSFKIILNKSIVFIKILIITKISMCSFETLDNGSLKPGNHQFRINLHKFSLETCNLTV